jgi:hypothetical protein
MQSNRTHTCWIGNIPSIRPKEELQNIFEVEAEKNGKYHSLFLNFSPKHNSYQCFINFFELNDALSAEQYFNNRLFDNQNLEAKYRPPKTNQY